MRARLSSVAFRTSCCESIIFLVGLGLSTVIVCNKRMSQSHYWFWCLDSFNFFVEPLKKSSFLPEIIILKYSNFISISIEMINFKIN